MSDPDAELDLLFDEMANDAALPDTAGSEARRRQRAIGGMRAMQRSLTAEQRAPQHRRRVIWIAAAAAAALCGTAFAAARGLLPIPFRPQQLRQPASAARAAPPRRAPVAATPPRAIALEAATTAATPPAPPTPPQAVPPQHSSSKPSSAPQVAYTAELEEVNRLFVEAKRAQREHRDADALALLQRLLTLHPGSVLTHEATVERFRTLARLGRTGEAQRGAQAYLSRYPAGFAADEARALVGKNP